jgi:hypothetical protein
VYSFSFNYNELCLWLELCIILLGAFIEGVFIEIKENLLSQIEGVFIEIKENLLSQNQNKWIT